MLNSLWWGTFKNEDKRGIRWASWERLCIPKKFGGMGFKRISDFNKAMLSKQGWKFLKEPDSLVSRIFKARYFPETNFLNASKGNNPSFIWASIMSAQDLVR